LLLLRFNEEEKRIVQIVQIATLLQTNTIMTTLILNNEKLTITAWEAVLEMLLINKPVRTLFLRYSNFDLECAQLLAKTLPFCSALTELDLQECNIGINGCYAIVNALCENPNGCQIEYLGLCETMENDSGDVEMKKRLAEKFVLLLQSPYTKLRELDLSSNKLGDDFVTIFVTGLKHNVRLEELYLYHNDITGVGAKALATVLYCNRMLTHLNLSNNSIGDDGAMAVSTALRYHPSIEVLNFTYNDMTEEGQLKMLQFLKYNEYVIYLYFNYVNNASVSIQSLDDYNDTAYRFGTCSRPGGSFAAHKKGSARRQHMFAWMARNWIDVDESGLPGFRPVHDRHQTNTNEDNNFCHTIKQSDNKKDCI
jgi:Ran GTPase-activating protein (RanGAP) involved in mRNA processing and transport